MAHIQGEVRIRRPVEDVFDFVADERSEPTYNPTCSFRRRSPSSGFNLLGRGEEPVTPATARRSEIGGSPPLGLKGEDRSEQSESPMAQEVRLARCLRRSRRQSAPTREPSR